MKPRTNPWRDRPLVIHPRALVVVESLFGNTERLAHAVATGLTIEGVEARVVAVGEAAPEVPADVDLLVVGAPTHVFSLSRPRTRADAVAQGAPPERAERGMREWLAQACPADPKHPPAVAAFDSRVARPRLLMPHCAARRALDLAQARGFEVRTGPRSFLVDDVTGPVSEGETDDALAWGRRLGRDARAHAAAAVHRGRLPTGEPGS
jgi:hypothetical protein